MKRICKYTAALAAILCITAAAEAQTAIDMAAHVEDATVEQIGQANATALKNKVSRIITRNGMADSEGLFAVVPTISITDQSDVDTGMTTMQVVRADFTLAVKNLVENTVFASRTVQLLANGKNSEACMRSLINRVNVNDSRFAALIQEVQQTIADYYKRQMPRLMATVNAHIAREEYEDAMVALSVIPDNVEEYQTVADLKIQVYNKLLAGQVSKAVAEANILVRQGDIDGALNLCRGCNPLSPNYGEVVAFLHQLDAEAEAAAAAEEERKAREADEARQRERMLESAKEQGEVLKAEKTEKCRKKGKSLGQVLFGL